MKPLAKFAYVTAIASAISAVAIAKEDPMGPLDSVGSVVRAMSEDAKSQTVSDMDVHTEECKARSAEIVDTAQLWIDGTFRIALQNRQSKMIATAEKSDLAVKVSMGRAMEDWQKAVVDVQQARDQLMNAIEQARQIEVLAAEAQRETEKTVTTVK